MTKTESKRDQRRLLQQELGRNQILDAAEEVFASRGFHEATIKDIAQLAEFSVGAVYSFFEKKDDLFVQIYLRRGAEFMEEMRELLSDDGDPVDQLHALARFQIGFMRKHPNFGRLYLRSSEFVLGEVESQIHQAVADNYSEAMNMERNLFERGQRAGAIRKGDSTVLGRLFSALVAGYQGQDPMVMTGSGEPAMSIGDFIDIIDGAFVIDVSATRRKR